MNMRKSLLALIAGCVVMGGSLWAMTDNIADYAANQNWDAVREILGTSNAIDTINSLDTKYRQHTALMWAIDFDNRDMVAELIKYGADVNAKDPNGWTALHSAVNQSNNVVTYLLNNGAADPQYGTINAVNGFGQTPLALAKDLKKEGKAAGAPDDIKDIINTLKQYGAQ